MSGSESLNLTRLLEKKVRASDLSPAEISRQLDRPDDHLARILEGQEPLEVHHLLEILQVLGVPSPEFFAELSAGPSPIGQEPSNEELDRVLTGGVTFRELRELVRETVRKATAASDGDKNA